MNINGVRTQGVANIYASNGAKRIKETNTDIGKDKIEISELGRNLSMYDNVDFNIDNSAKIEELKAKIQNERGRDKPAAGKSRRLPLFASRKKLYDSPLRRRTDTL